MFIYLGYYLALGSKLRLSTALHRIVASMVYLSNGTLTTGSTQTHQWQYCCTSIAAGDRVSPNMEACTLSPSLLPPQSVRIQFSFSISELSNFSMHMNIVGIWLNLNLDSLNLGWDLIVCIINKLPSDAGAIDPWTTLRVAKT